MKNIFIRFFKEISIFGKSKIMYQTIEKVTLKFLSKAQLFKYGFNFSPMYKRSTAKIVSVSDDIYSVKIRLKRSWKNKNYMGSIFGGSLFSATDPIYMIQLVQILGKKYVVWDKSTTIKFKRPAYNNAFAEFIFTSEEIENIKKDVAKHKEIDYTKPLNITDKNGTIFCELEKTLYIADKEFYKEKRRQKQKK